jgi:tetratricopeptide (TPR) repeat protein
MPYTLDYIFRALGAFLALIVLPLLIATIAKLFKRLFWGVLLKSLAIISIPVSLLSFIGAYYEYNENKKIPAEVSPSKYNPTNHEIKDFQSKTNSQTFLNIEQVNQAIKKSPTNAINYYNRGIIYASELKHNLAINDYSKAIELDPNFSSAYLNRSAEYIFLNDFNNALSDCSKAIQLNPNLSEAYFNRAKIKIHM